MHFLTVSDSARHQVSANGMFWEPLCDTSPEPVNTDTAWVAPNLLSAIELGSLRCERAIYMSVFFSLVPE